MYNHNDDKLHPLANVILLDHPSLFFSVIILQTPKARGKQCNVPKLTVLLSFGEKKMVVWMHSTVYPTEAHMHILFSLRCFVLLKELRYCKVVPALSMSAHDTTNLHHDVVADCVAAKDQEKQKVDGAHDESIAIDVQNGPWGRRGRGRK